MSDIDDLIYPLLAASFPEYDSGEVLDVVKEFKQPRGLDKPSEFEQEVWQKYLQLKKEQMKVQVILRNDVNCPECTLPHSDIDEWAIKPHKTHLCGHCGSLFEGEVKGVSSPKFQALTVPDNIVYIEYKQ